jgi:hypothetical protein
MSATWRKSCEVRSAADEGAEPAEDGRRPQRRFTVGDEVAAVRGVLVVGSEDALPLRQGPAFARRDVRLAGSCG